MTDGLRIRPARDGDWSFIVHSFIETYAMSHYGGPFNENEMWAAYIPVVERLRKRPTLRVSVACSTENDDQILGYLLCEVSGIWPVLHFAYVKSLFRGLGVLKALLDAIGIDLGKPFYHTCQTRHWVNVRNRRLRRGQGFGGTFDPNFIRHEPDGEHNGPAQSRIAIGALQKRDQSRRKRVLGDGEPAQQGGGGD